MNLFQRCFSIIILALLIVTCKQADTVSLTKHPNVILIMCDDLNDYQGAFGGHPQAHTPNIDKLAASGVRFINAQTNIGLCNPSRNSLFTGVYPHQSRNFGLDTKSTKQLFKNNKTIMEQFSEKGYYVMGSGKLLHSNQKHLWDEWGVQINNYGPFAYDGEKQVGHPSVPQPFRSIGDIDGSYAPLSDIPKFKDDEVKGENVGWTYSGKDGKVFNYIDETNRDLLPDELHAQWAAKRIKEMDVQENDQPFFMGIGFVRPHTPLYAPKRFFDMFPIEELKLPVIKEGDADDTYYKCNYPVERTKDDKWYTNTSKGQVYSKMLTQSYGNNEEEGLKHFLQAYLACVAFVDEQVGVVLDALNDSQFAKNTIVVLTSDHGWQMGQKQYLFKNSPWENSTRIPLVVNMPGVKPGTLVEQPVSLVDIYPSLIDICNLGNHNRKNEEGLPLGGYSFKALLNDPTSDDWNGPKGALTAIATDVVDYNIEAQTFTYRTQEFRYITYPDGSEELYDLNNDPFEWHNLANDPAYAPSLSELKKQVNEIINGR
ncbi:sulfatase [Carboxylicivirga mesophila]|uniref:Sulfatase n=1 Tax=Carboxylicivirga mesophila TaxID=1166478 RepID=A0ABS5K9S7_9BACT|nr:sulfatase [Carboxylicivirga mesophila]MBS2211283.1 sulfatase [Carboxylicivirga mesophila]